MESGRASLRLCLFCAFEMGIDIGGGNAPGGQKVFLKDI